MAATAVAGEFSWNSNIDSGYAILAANMARPPHRCAPGKPCEVTAPGLGLGLGLGLDLPTAFPLPFHSLDLDLPLPSPSTALTLTYLFTAMTLIFSLPSTALTLTWTCLSIAG